MVRGSSRDGYCGEAECFWVGAAAVFGQGLAEGAGPVGDGAAADLAAGEGQMGDGGREAPGLCRAHFLPLCYPCPAVPAPWLRVGRGNLRGWDGRLGGRMACCPDSEGDSAEVCVRGGGARRRWVARHLPHLPALYLLLTGAAPVTERRRRRTRRGADVHRPVSDQDVIGYLRPPDRDPAGRHPRSRDDRHRPRKLTPGRSASTNRRKRRKGGEFRG
jgi:hypothetical protein